MNYVWGLFDCVGIEIEYAVVDAVSLDVRPVVDQILGQVYCTTEDELQDGDIAWSHELANHVIELKTNGPALHPEHLAESFRRSLGNLYRLLEPLSLTLLPGAMHPWMNPQKELQLWPHGDRSIYDTYDRIFDCRGHGWANLQSMHINLPFADETEFAQLHSAIRVLMPFMPALTASSPIAEQKPTGFMDYRLEVYRTNSARIPMVAGLVVPESIRSRRHYVREILNPLYEALSEHDPEGILRYEWVNARGAIARFDRGAIEIRVLDTQECPELDIALARFINTITRGIVRGAFLDRREANAIETAMLAQIFNRVAKEGEAAVVDEKPLLQYFGIDAPKITAGEFWQRMYHSFSSELAGIPMLAQRMSTTNLGQRILTRVGGDYSRDNLREVYRQLVGCLARGEMFA